MNSTQLKCVGCYVGAAILLFVQNTMAEENAPPNVVLVVADDLGYGEVGCYGQKWIQTPRLDELASEGIRFTQFYAGSPVCAPSRCVLMTGKHSGHAFIRDNRDGRELNHLAEANGWEYPGQWPIPAEEITIAEAVKQRDYATGAMGKWGLGHFGTTGAPNQQGFDLFFGYNCQRHAHNHYPRFLWRNSAKVQYPGNDGQSLYGETYSQDEFTREALQFIRDHQRTPFFLYLPLIIPHLAIQAPEESLAWYTDTIPEHEYEHRGYLKHPRPHAGYAAMVTHMDRDIGKIVDLIDELGLGENTLIIFTSDNGPTYDRIGGADSDFFQSTGGLRGRKGSVYEGGLRVPMIARWTGQIEAGQQTDLISAFWDFLPTICDAVGVTPPRDTDGVSLLRTMTGRGNQTQHEYLLWEFAGYGGQQAVRMGKWKAVRINTKRGNRNIELYDLSQDRSESNDVAAEYPEVVEKVEHILQTDRTESERFSIFPEEDPQREHPS